MNKFKLITLIVPAFLMAYSYAKDVILDEKAVQVPLPVGKEIIVKFPKAVTKTEDLNSDKQKKLSQLLRPDGVLMLEAGEAFGETRLVATMIDGNIIILDLNAQIGAVNYQTINLVDPKTLKATPKPAVKKNQPKINPHKPAFLKPGAALTKNGSAPHVAATEDVGFNEMVQFAFRHYTGPSRLIGRQKAKRVSVHNVLASKLVRVWGGRLSVKALQQWKMGNKYVTVILVNNRSAVPVQFDPRALRGRIMFSAALYPIIQPRGSVNDQTLWAVVTNVPFNKAVK